MRWVKLGIFLLLVAILVAATLIFKDPLAERGLEAALQGVFGARAEVDGLHLGLLRGRVRLASLAVADKQEPMTNLFQLGPTEAALDLGQLLRRKVVIESVSCSDIRWGTPRAVSGALPGAEAGAAPAAAKSGGGPALPGLDQLGFDPQALLAAEKANLKSPAAYEQANDALAEGSERWKARAASVGQKVDKIGEGVAAIGKIDFRAVKSLDEARKAYDAVEGLAPVLADAQRDLKGAGGDFKADLGKLRAGLTGANTLLEQDVRYLRSRVALPQGGLRGAVSALARGVVEKKLGRFSSLAFRALDAVAGMREGGSASKVKAKPAGRAARREGRDVPFATTAYPSFLLKSFAFSVKPEGATLDGGIQDLSSNPELWGKPASFRADYRTAGRSVEVSGEVDSREASMRARVRAEGGGLDFALSDLPLIGSAAGSYAFETTAEVARDGVTGQAVVTTGPIRAGEAQGVAGGIVRDAIAGAKTVSLDIDYKMAGGDFAITLRSNLDDEVSRQLASRLADLKADYQKKAEDELRKSLAPEVSRAQREIASLDKTGGEIAALDARTEGYRREIEAKKAEYTAALTRLAGGRLRLPGF